MFCSKYGKTHFHGIYGQVVARLWHSRNSEDCVSKPHVSSEKMIILCLCISGNKGKLLLNEANIYLVWAVTKIWEVGRERKCSDGKGGGGMGRKNLRSNRWMSKCPLPKKRQNNFAPLIRANIPEKVQGLMYVIIVIQMFWDWAGSWVFSRRSQISIYPSSRPM